MIRKKFVLYVVFSVAICAFTAPSLAQNIFLGGSDSAKTSSKKKDKGFFSSLFGWGDDKEEKQKIAIQVNNAVVGLTSDALSPSGFAPKTAEEYLARANVLNAKYKQAARKETALSREKVSYASQLFDQQAEQAKAAQGHTPAFQPVVFKPAAPKQAETSKKSKTIQAKTPLVQPKSKKKSSSGVFTKY